MKHASTVAMLALVMAASRGSAYAQGAGEEAPLPLAEAIEPDAVTDAPVTPAAPEAAAAPKHDEVRNRLIEEVVVTAGKREQNLQEVAASVQAFSGSTLDAKGVSDLKDLALVTPGLNYDSMASYSIIFIRGVGGDAFQAGVDSSVATYIDGLYLPATFASAQALGDVKNVEVLKGPQGALYGRNAIAGAITVNLKEPSPVFGIDALAQLGDYNDAKAKVSVTGAVPFTGDTLSASGSVLYENRDAYTTFYLDPSQKYRPYRNVGFRGALKWQPIDDLEIQASYYDTKSQDADSVANTLLKPALAFRTILTAHDTPHESSNQPSVGASSHTKIINITLKSTLVDWFDQRLILGRTSANSDIEFDYDSAPQTLLDAMAVNTAKSDSAEMIFTSNPATAPEHLEWIAGLYYSESDRGGSYTIPLDLAAIALGLPLSNPFGGKSPLCDLLERQLGFDCSNNTSTNQNPLVQLPLNSGLYSEARSIYGQMTLNVTDQAAVVLGGRASSEFGRLDYASVNAQVVGGNGAPITPVVPAIPYPSQSHTWKSFTPTAGLNYKLTPDVLLYYKYSEAFKSGNFNGLNLTNPPNRIEPERAAGNEIGFKSELLDDRSVKFNGALFTTIIDNAQVQTLALTSGGALVLENAASYRVEGAELEFNWFITDGLVVGALGNYLRGEYLEFRGRGFSDTTGLDQEDIDFSGNRTIRTPKLSGTAFASYGFGLPLSLQGEAAADVFYNSGYFYDPLNTLQQDAYHVINARLGVFDPRRNLRVTAFVKNLNDAVVFSQKYRQDFGDTGYYGAPRTLGVTLTWTY